MKSETRYHDTSAFEPPPIGGHFRKIASHLRDGRHVGRPPSGHFAVLAAAWASSTSRPKRVAASPLWSARMGKQQALTRLKRVADFGVFPACLNSQPLELDVEVVRDQGLQRLERPLAVGPVGSGPRAS